jgi:pilus assembly protein CpaE
MSMSANHFAQAANRLRVVTLTADSEFEQVVRYTFGANAQIELALVKGGLSDDVGPEFDGATIAIVDLNHNDGEALAALHRLSARIGGSIPVIVVSQSFNEAVGRRLLQMRVADFLVKPVTPVELARTCAKVAQNPTNEKLKEAQIFTFLPAGGGVGVTTLAIQTALVLLASGPLDNRSTCLVDLNFQDGACADYLDIEPRLDLDEVVPHPQRLDRQLLEIMLSHHTTGLAVLAAPHRPAEMRQVEASVVTRLLDLVSSSFDFAVIDMPRGWYPWSDSILRGSNKLFVVSDMTVPGLRQAKQLLAAISDRVGESTKPRVIINRFEQPFLSPRIRRADIRQALGDAFGGAIPYDRRLVCEAIDRGVPLSEVKARNQVDAVLKQLVLPAAGGRSADSKRGPVQTVRKLIWAQ